MNFSKLALILAAIWCRDFAVIFAIFTKVWRVFHRFLPGFSTVPNYIALVSLSILLKLKHVYHQRARHKLCNHHVSKHLLCSVRNSPKYVVSVDV